MPELQPFHPLTLALIALFNPGVIVVGFLMGRRADQWQKLIIAGFAAGLAGAVVVWLAVRVGVLPSRGIGGEGGLFAFSVVLGTLWATLGFLAARRTK